MFKNDQKTILAAELNRPGEFAAVPNEPHWHHYVPRWYLKGFADDDRRLRCLHVSGYARIFPVKRIAAAEHFYTEWTDGSPDLSWEHSLARLENDAAPIARAITKDRRMPEGDSKTVLALYIAAQMLRTPFYRNMVRRMTEIPFPLPQESALALMDTFIGTYADELLTRPWQCLVAPGKVFVTTDQPVGLWSPQWNGRDPIGLADASEVRWPLDRSHALILGPSGIPGDGYATASLNMIYSMLGTSTAWQEEWLFDHPEGVYRDVSPDLMRKAAAEMEGLLSGHSGATNSLAKIDRHIRDGILRLVREDLP